MKEAIDALSHVAMARIWRFSPSSEPMIQGEAAHYFWERFQGLGGMTPEVREQIGQARRY